MFNIIKEWAQYTLWQILLYEAMFSEWNLLTHTGWISTSSIHLYFKIYWYWLVFKVSSLDAQVNWVQHNSFSHLYNRNIYEVHTISFQTFFVLAFEIVIDSWKFSMLLLYILWDDWPIFMISGSNEQLQQQLEYTLLKPDSRSWWISKMQSGHEDTLEERYVLNLE